MDRYLGIGEAAKALGVSIPTLRRWEAAGKIQVEHTAGGHRRYDLAKDVLEIITVFSARLYGSRSRKDQKLLDKIKAAVEYSDSC